MNAISVRSTLGRRAALAAAAMVVVLASLALASGARAAELLYWDNWSGATADSVAFANIDGTGGGLLNLGGLQVFNPEGMAIDTAGGRLFVASSGEFDEEGNLVHPSQILVANLSGSGASAFAPPGAPIDVPEGIAIDPATGLVFWANYGSGGSKGSIAWARLDGSAGGVLNTAGAEVSSPYRLAVDPVTGRVFWSNTGGEELTISYAAENNTGGGNLDLSGAPLEGMGGLAVDSVAGRLYWSGAFSDTFSSVSVNGGGGSPVDVGTAPVDEGYGLAVDPSVGRLYWANYGNRTERTGAFGISVLAGGAGAINIATAPVEGPQDPQILKSPTGTGAPVLARLEGSHSAFTCSTGSWAADYAGGYVYQAPTTYAYQWAKGGAPIAGATAASYTATAPGTYTCTVTAANQAGSAAQASAAAKVKAAKFKLVLKTKKAKAKAGKLATIRVQALNQGDLRSNSSRICVKLTKQQRTALKQPKCKQLGKVSADKRKTVKLKVKVKPDAEKGLYKLKLVPKGTGGKAVTAKLRVLG